MWKHSEKALSFGGQGLEKEKETHLDASSVKMGTSSS